MEKLINFLASKISTIFIVLILLIMLWLLDLAIHNIEVFENRYLISLLSVLINGILGYCAISVLLIKE